jgi:hypothetical protein
MSEEHELVAIAVELEHYWSEQWRRATEICDLLEQRLATGPSTRPVLRVVGASAGPAAAEPEPPRPTPKLVDG